MDNLWLKVENIVAKGEIACFEQISKTQALEIEEKHTQIYGYDF